MICKGDELKEEIDSKTERGRGRREKGEGGENAGQREREREREREKGIKYIIIGLQSDE